MNGKWRSVFRKIGGAVLMSALGGCTVVKAGEGGVSRTLVGLVRVELPPTRGQLSAVEIQALGLGWDQGPFFGYRGASWVTAPPDSCQLTIIIRSSAEALQASRLLDDLKGKDLCTVDFTSPRPGSSPP